MKIVQVNTVCENGSIPKIMLDLFNTAKTQGHTCYIAYGRGNAAKDIFSYKIGTHYDFFCHVMRNFFKGESGFGSRKQTLKFLSWLDIIQPDIIHLHNIHGFYIQIELLFEYIKQHNIKTIWTLHDCWAFTGQCAYFDYVNCQKWTSGCHDCPIYRTSYPYSLFKDNSKMNYQRKKNAFSNVSNLTLITPSHWLLEQVKKSFLKDYPIITIPNGINPQNYRFLSLSKIALRQQLIDYPININKKILLGVANVWDKRKGLHFFEEMIPLLSSDHQIILIGLNSKQIRHFEKYPNDILLPLAHTNSQQELCLFYNIADIFINPTLEDNFPTTNLESLACGTPVITFHTGGSGECINENCGLILNDKNYESLANTIKIWEQTRNVVPQKITENVLTANHYSQLYIHEYTK